jgi:hypothetical protein
MKAINHMDRAHLLQIIAEHGVLNVVRALRDECEQVADPTASEDSEGMRCYYALNGFDEFITDLEKFSAPTH